MSTHAWLELALWSLWAVLMTWMVAVSLWMSARRYGHPVAPDARIRRVSRALRPLVWPVYTAYALVGLFQADTVRDLGLTIAGVALVGWLVWRAWVDSKDDDDWLKRLIEKGRGVVQRFGDRLRVVAPAPSPA